MSERKHLLDFWLEAIQDTLDRGEFVEPPVPVGATEGERVIGEMTRYERAIFTAAGRVPRKLRLGQDAVCQHCRETDSQQSCVIRHFIMRQERMMALLRMEIRHRLNMWYHGIDVRRGFKIVVLDREAELKDPDKPIMLVAIAEMAEMAEILEHEHHKESPDQPFMVFPSGTEYVQ